MRKLLPVVALILLCGGALRAQDMTGTWQGVLQAPQREFRQVIRVTREASGELRVLLYSIDQNGQGAPGTMTVQGSTVRMAVPSINITYEGRLSADGNGIAGSVSQGASKLALNLSRATPTTAWEIPAPPAALKPMAADATPTFEVATIKPNVSGQPGRLYTVRGRQVMTVNTTASDLITFAYGVHARQITGAPDWAGTDKYDVTGVPDIDGLPNQQQMRMLVQKLLADRFKLTFHRDKRELPVYAITLLKTGHKLTRSDENAGALPSLIFRGLGTLPGRNATVAELASVMQNAVLDRPVIDQTGLAGRWDFALTWTPDEFQFGGLGVRPPPPPDNATAPNLFTAFQEQLGLRLETTRAPAEVLVIDRVEKPTVD